MSDLVRDGRNLMDRVPVYIDGRREMARVPPRLWFGGTSRPAPSGYWGDPSMFRGPEHPNYREQRVGNETA